MYPTPPITIVTPERARLMEEIASIGAETYAVKMWERGVPLVLKLIKQPAYAANIIKQEALASGIDAAVNRGAANCSVKQGDILVIGNVRGVKILAGRLKKQGGVFVSIAEELERVAGSVCLDPKPFVLRLRDRLQPLGGAVMGILNVTPDSFSDGGSYDTSVKVSDRLKQIFDEGGIFADIGGVSTRPGYSPVTLEEEEKRVLPAVEAGVKIASDYGAYISVDTTEPLIAEKALRLGADMINDQHALNTPGMAEVCAEYKAAVVLMHNPKECAESVPDDLPRAVAQIKDCLVNAAKKAVRAGIPKDSVVIDPGFGFGKSLKIQYGILKYMFEFSGAAYPLLAGISRKSMLGVSGRGVADRGYLTAAAETAAMLGGAAILRSHNVAAALDVVNFASALNGRGF
jgi:dihydropteroate synthase